MTKKQLWESKLAQRSKSVSDKTIKEQRLTINVEYVIDIFADGAHYYAEDFDKRKRRRASEKHNPSTSDIKKATKYSSLKEAKSCVEDALDAMLDYQEFYAGQEDVDTTFDGYIVDEAWKPVDTLLAEGLVRIITVIRDKEVTEKEIQKLKELVESKQLKEAYDDFADAIMRDGTKVNASASTRSTRTYNYEDVEFEFGARKGRGTYRWMNRPWQKFDFADALKNAMIDAGVDKEFARECIDKSGSLRSAVEYFAKNYKIDKKEITKEEVKEEVEENKTYQIQYWLTEEDRNEGFSDIFIDTFETKAEAIKVARKMVDRDNYASVEVYDVETNEVVFGYDGITTWRSEEDILEEKNNDKGAKIASIIASALNKQGGHGPMGNEEVVADENTITLVSQAGLETYKFNNDGSVDNLSIDDMIKTMLEDGDIEESEIEDIHEEYGHFNSIKDLLQSNLTWFMELPEKLIIKKIEEILGEEEKLEEAIDLDKHVWEGWTVQDFIDELEPLFDQIMSGRSWQKPFKDKAELKAWCMDNQPYYKRYIPGVVEYFFKKMKKNENLNEKLVEYDPARWEPEDIELHKSIDWKERNWEDFVVEDDSFETDVMLYGLGKNKNTEKRKTVEVFKTLRANPIYPPYYGAIEQPFIDVVGPMFNGNKHGKYSIHDRYETQEHYDSMFD